MKDIFFILILMSVAICLFLTVVFIAKSELKKVRRFNKNIVFKDLYFGTSRYDKAYGKYLQYKKCKKCEHFCVNVFGHQECWATETRIDGDTTLYTSLREKHCVQRNIGGKCDYFEKKVKRY